MATLPRHRHQWDSYIKMRMRHEILKKFVESKGRKWLQAEEKVEKAEEKGRY